MIILFGGPIFDMPGADGKRYRFEDHRIFGPIRLNRDDDPAHHNFGQRHPFWSLYERWVKLGKPSEDGTCKLNVDLPDSIRNIEGGS